MIVDEIKSFRCYTLGACENPEELEIEKDK